MTDAVNLNGPNAYERRSSPARARPSQLELIQSTSVQPTKQVYP